MARLEIGGKYGKQVMFKGNKRFLPVHIRRVIDSYFNVWNGLKDIAQYPALVSDLGAARADKHFVGTDWVALQKLYEEHMQRHVLVLRGLQVQGSAPRFALAQLHAGIARPVKALVAQYADEHGVLSDTFDIWRLEKLLRRAKAQLKFEPSFVQALRRFGANAVSVEESLSFFRQIQAYHAPEFLRPELQAILHEYLDAVHTMTEPLKLPELLERLRTAGANLRVHPDVENVLAHHASLLQASAETVGSGAELPVAAELKSLLKTELYPFQRFGVAFLTVTRRALLADDMGLGKTLQAIAAALVLKRRGDIRRVLIVCPASLKYQWQSEIQRFSGERCEVIGGDKDERELIYRAAGSSWLHADPVDKPLFYVVNYELVYRDIAQLKQLAPELLILDEAQRVKNFRTKTAQSVFEIDSPYCFVLTGTPLENQLMELYTILRFIDERCLGRNPIAFRDRYVILDQFGGILGYKLVEEVTRKIDAVTLRRTKQQTLAELPPLIEQQRWLDLTDVQRQIYQELQGQARQVLRQELWDAAATNNALTALQRLREVCDSPELIDPQHTESQKLSELLALLDDEVTALDRQVIVFTQWTRMGEIIMRELRQRHLSAGFLHGGIPTDKRQPLLERFTRGEDRVFVSTDAGGTGLNLQAASLVVNYDLPFNPARLNQRIARAHRLGQQQTVFVVNLVCRNTIETKLLAILKEKQQLFDDVFGEISDPAQQRAPAAAQRSLRELMWALIE